MRRSQHIMNNNEMNNRHQAVSKSCRKYSLNESDSHIVYAKK